jgi:hypothetical protein
VIGTSASMAAPVFWTLTSRRACSSMRTVRRVVGRRRPGSSAPSAQRVDEVVAERRGVAMLVVDREGVETVENSTSPRRERLLDDRGPPVRLT